MYNSNTNIEEIASNLLNACREQLDNSNPFLLFDLAHADENAHTRVLLYLLNYKKRAFLNSFFKEVLGIDDQFKIIKITDQEQAIGKKGNSKGFIDLYINYEVDSIPHHVIIENKIYGAGDTEKQLARYIATVAGVKNNDFNNNWYNEESIKSRLNNIHVYYLTDNGDNEPSEDSLPRNLLNAVTYKPINYKEHILPWLDTVLNSVVKKDGSTITSTGLIQYINTLTRICEKKETTKYVKEILENKISLISEDGKKLLELWTKLKQSKTNDNNNYYANLLIKELDFKIQKLYKDDTKGINGKWKLRVTPSFIVLYKESWIGSKEHNYASIHFHIDMLYPQNRKKDSVRVILYFDHIKDHSNLLANLNYKRCRFKKSKIDRNIARAITLPNFVNYKIMNTSKDRQAFIKAVLSNGIIKKCISKIDNALEGTEDNMEVFLKNYFTEKTNHNTSGNSSGNSQTLNVNKLKE